MKALKSIPFFFAAGAIVFGTACSSTSTGNTGADPSVGATRTGTDMNPTPAPDANSGMAPNGATTTSTAGTTSSTDGTAAGGAADMAAFQSSFATMQDPVFLMNAASSNMLEIRAGQMAYQKASNAEVRKFAEMMVNHHTRATQMLKSVAMPMGVSLPTTMMPVHQALSDRLMNKSGKNFDETYMDLMETAHKMDIAMFEVKSKAAETTQVQTFATNTLPMLREHYDMAAALEKKVD